MKIKYTLGQRCMAYILLTSLFLQSCNHLPKSLIPIEEQGDDSQLWVNQDFFTEEHKGCIVVPGGLANTQEDLGEEDEQENEEFQKKEIKIDSYKFSLLGELSLVPRDVLQETLSYLGLKEIGKVRALSKSFYKLTTGYDQVGLVGVNNKPAADCLKLAANTKSFHFSLEEGHNFTPETIPSLEAVAMV